MSDLRPELTPLPARMHWLPLDPRGYPIPAFVDTLPDGTRDFRFMSPAHWMRCWKQSRCWVCGQRLGAYKVFVIGPMCAVNRTTSEPPCHRECALWSVKNCPFLARPHMHRREDDFTREQEIAAPPAGVMIKRNPGAMCLWTTKSYEVFDDGEGKPLITIGDPVEVLWYAEAHPATRAEVEESIATGLPLLEKIAREDRDPEAALRHLAQQREAVKPLLPIP
jgi:hypothetical protein